MGDYICTEATEPFVRIRMPKSVSLTIVSSSAAAPANSVANTSARSRARRAHARVDPSNTAWYQELLRKVAASRSSSTHLVSPSPPLTTSADSSAHLFNSSCTVAVVRIPDLVASPPVVMSCDASSHLFDVCSAAPRVSIPPSSPATGVSNEMQPSGSFLDWKLQSCVSHWTPAEMSKAGMNVNAKAFEPVPRPYIPQAPTVSREPSMTMLNACAPEWILRSSDYNPLAASSPGHASQSVRPGGPLTELPHQKLENSTFVEPATASSSDITNIFATPLFDWSDESEDLPSVEFKPLVVMEHKIDPEDDSKYPAEDVSQDTFADTTGQQSTSWPYFSEAYKQELRSVTRHSVIHRNVASIQVPAEGCLKQNGWPLKSSSVPPRPSGLRKAATTEPSDQPSYEPLILFSDHVAFIEPVQRPYPLSSSPVLRELMKVAHDDAVYNHDVEPPAQSSDNVQPDFLVPIQGSNAGHPKNNWTCLEAASEIEVAIEDDEFYSPTFPASRDSVRDVSNEEYDPFAGEGAIAHPQGIIDTLAPSCAQEQTDSFSVVKLSTANGEAPEQDVEHFGGCDPKVPAPINAQATSDEETPQSSPIFESNFPQGSSSEDELHDCVADDEHMSFIMPFPGSADVLTLKHTGDATPGQPVVKQLLPEMSPAISEAKTDESQFPYNEVQASSPQILPNRPASADEAIDEVNSVFDISAVEMLPNSVLLEKYQESPEPEGEWFGYEGLETAVRQYIADSTDISDAPVHEIHSRSTLLEQDPDSSEPEGELFGGEAIKKCIKEYIDDFCIISDVSTSKNLSRSALLEQYRELPEPATEWYGEHIGVQAVDTSCVEDLDVHQQPPSSMFETETMGKVHEPSPERDSRPARLRRSQFFADLTSMVGAEDDQKSEILQPCSVALSSAQVLEKFCESSPEQDTRPAQVDKGDDADQAPRAPVWSTLSSAQLLKKYREPQRKHRVARSLHLERFPIPQDLPAVTKAEDGQGSEDEPQIPPKEDDVSPSKPSECEMPLRMMNDDSSTIAPPVRDSTEVTEEKFNPETFDAKDFDDDAVVLDDIERAVKEVLSNEGTSSETSDGAGRASPPTGKTSPDVTNGVLPEFSVLSADFNKCSVQDHIGALAEGTNHHRPMAALAEDEHSICEEESVNHDACVEDEQSGGEEQDEITALPDCPANAEAQHEVNMVRTEPSLFLCITNMLTSLQSQPRKVSWKSVQNKILKKSSTPSNLPRPTSRKSSLSTLGDKLKNFAKPTKASLARDNSKATMKPDSRQNTSRQPSWGSFATVLRRQPLVPKKSSDKKSSSLKATVKKTLNELRPHPDLRKI